MTVVATGSGVRAELRGRGPLLVLLAGYGQTAAVWEPVLPRLSGSFTCVLTDLRGLGTAAGRTPVTIEAMAADVAELIGELGGPAAVVGWSMGGVVAQTLAARHPGRVAALGLLSTTSRRSAVQRSWTRLRIALQESGAPREVVETAVLPWLSTGRTLADPRRFQALARANAALPAAPVAALRAQADALDAADTTALLPGITAPALVLTAAEDVVTPVPDAIALARGLPAAELVVVPYGGHAAVLEHPAEVCAPLLRFLRAQAPATLANAH